MNFAKRLDKHFAACAAVAASAAMLGAENTQAAIHYFNPNLNVPSTTAGIYLNVVTGVVATTPGAVPGWDLNPWSSGANNFWANNAASPSDGIVSNFTGGSSATLVDNLAIGTMVDGSWTYGRTNSSETTGATAMQLNSSNNYIGFRFLNEGTGTLMFGWAHFQLTGLGTQPRTLIDYAWEDSGQGILVGAGAPAPGALALLGLAGFGVGGRRRK